MNTTADTSPTVFRTHRLEIVDNKGRVRITLGAEEDGPHLTFYDEQGHIQISLGMHVDHQPTLLLFEHRVPRIELGIKKDGDPTLALFHNRSVTWGDFIKARWNQRDDQARARYQRRAQKKKAA
ncbi:MAG: hypothetical protein FJ147_04870 [Deltaproteobacteria bacterium]|nr:hypothetical protein [Deltaproteobacteria bacterium]